MDAAPFTPSLDWGNAFLDSVGWIARAWLISAICVVGFLVVLRFATRWGQQCWRITGGYFSGRRSVKVWLMLGVLLLSVITEVRLNVLFSYQNRDLYNGLQSAVEGLAAHNDAVRRSGVHGFWASLAIFSIIAGIYIARVQADMYLLQRFVLAWRVWLTDELTADWMDGRAYYRERFVGNAIDNPEQRIQQDIDVLTAGVGATPNEPGNRTATTLLFGALQSGVTVISFAMILWNLSGPLNILGLEIPRAIFWVLISYVLVATLITFWIGHPLIKLSFANEKLNAAFRYALVRVHESAEAVALYRGELAERMQLTSRFAPLVRNYRRYVNRTVGYWGWNASVSQVIVPLPWLLQAPRLFAGKLSIGDVQQTYIAFTSIHDSLSFFRNHYAAFASYRAAIMRLHGLVEANACSRELPQIAVASSRDGSVAIAAVEVRTPAGDQLIDRLDLRLDRGEALVITGRSGVGKTTLLRALAQLWPFASGSLSRPDGQGATMFLSQLPYVPLGDLRSVVCYPNARADITDDAVCEALAKVFLAPLCDRLDEERDWAKVLSPGEQQRLAFARILLSKPQVVFHDESTSALDEGMEFGLYRLMRNELPECIVVSVSHRHSVEQHHARQLELLGQGQWRLGRV